MENGQGCSEARWCSTCRNKHHGACRREPRLGATNQSGPISYGTDPSLPDAYQRGKTADVVSVTFIFNSLPTHILFDSGADHSFVSDSFCKCHSTPIIMLSDALVVEVTSGELVVIHEHYEKCILEGGNDKFVTNVVKEFSHSHRDGLASCSSSQNLLFQKDDQSTDNEWEHRHDLRRERKEDHYDYLMARHIEIILNVSPWKQIIRFRKHGKLSPRFVGPFSILEKVGLQAYRLELLLEIDGIDPTFHVCYLRGCLAKEECIILVSEIRVDTGNRCVEEPETILEMKTKKFHHKEVTMVKVQWKHH
ncbi:LOW QUALITY PROTEIN: hypothetical protein OSB04_028253 [Centaurea solstitialis]|uniref:Tf2-1-like SH3-like domain-containing protein n=1 Tax=Centaurea solstitialis TaxID=347529 RepID=A0AA38VXI3_9ASTR|nr:LOW QUALITY PROTEIN: hypothetical protein OSB04_028253 [Centaurea solstitialis]